MISWPSGGTREGRVLSRRRPSTPASAKRSCQRQTQVFDVPVRRMISTVPRPAAESSTISARQTCFCGAFRLLTIPSSRPRSEALRTIEMPGRIPQTRMPPSRPESPPGLACQVRSTSRSVTTGYGIHCRRAVTPSRCGLLDRSPQTQGICLGHALGYCCTLGTMAISFSRSFDLGYYSLATQPRARAV